MLGGVSLTVRDEKHPRLVGINGAGKSTLLRLLAGVLRANAGSIRFDGEEIFDNARKKRELFLLPDEPYYAADTTAAKLLSLYSAFYPIDLARYEEYEEKFHLARRAPVRTFSKGMKRQLFVAIALACRPRYLLLDEAFDGLDPAGAAGIQARAHPSAGRDGQHGGHLLPTPCASWRISAPSSPCWTAAQSLRRATSAARWTAYTNSRSPSTANRSERTSPSNCFPSRRKGGWRASLPRGDRDEILHKVEALSRCSWRRSPSTSKSCSCAKSRQGGTCNEKGHALRTEADPAAAVHLYRHRGGAVRHHRAELDLYFRK